MVWSEILQKTKDAKELIQKHHVLNPLAKGAIGAIPIVGDVLLEIWEQSAASDDDKSAQILETLKIIESGNEQNFNRLCQQFQEHKNAIIENKNKLNEILYEQHKLLEQVGKISYQMSEVKSDTSQIKNMVAEIKEEIGSLREKSKTEISNMEIGLKLVKEEPEKLPLEFYNQIQERDKKIQHLTEKLKIVNEKPEEDLEYLIKEANVLSLYNKYEKALNLYNKVLERSPNNVSAVFNKGDALIKLDRDEEAYGLFRKALDKNPKEGYYWRGLANSIQKKCKTINTVKNWEQQVVFFEKSTELDPSNDEFRIKALKCRQSIDYH